MTRDDPRPFVVTGFAFLALAVAWALPGALGRPLPLRDALAWFLLAGWLFPAWLGTLVWYWQPFVQRALPPAWVTRAPLAFLVLALGALVVVALAPPRASTLAFAWFTRALAVALVLPALVFGARAVTGARWRGGVPKWRAKSPHKEGDALAALAGAGALAHAAAAGVVLVAFPYRGPGAPAFTFLAAGVAVQAQLALALHFLPRVVKRPLRGLAAAGAALALAALNAGAAGRAAAFLAADAGVLAARGATFTALALVVLGVAFVVFPFRAPRGSPPRLLVAGRAWLTGSGVVLTLAGVVALAASTRAVVAGVLHAPLLTLLVTGSGLAFAGFTVLAWPVAFNAVPRGAAWARAGASAGTVGALLVAGGLVVPGGARAGALFLVVAALAHAWQLAPLRAPRRECPPSR